MTILERIKIHVLEKLANITGNAQDFYRLAMEKYNIYNYEQRSDRVEDDIISDFEKAANAGNPNAAWMLYQIYTSTDKLITTKQNKEKSDVALTLAAKNGKDEAQFLLGMRYKEESIKKFSKKLGEKYEKEPYNWLDKHASTLGLNQDEIKDIFKETYYWLGQAARQGHLKAQYRLGLLYLDTQDIVNAKACLQKAATNEVDADINQETRTKMIADAKYRLGMLYVKEKELEEAKKLIREAAESGHTAASYECGMFCLDDENVEEAIEWLEKSGNSDALYELGIIAENKGETNEAVKYFVDAQHNGHIEAGYELYRLSKQPEAIRGHYKDNGIRALLEYARTMREKNAKQDYIEACEQEVLYRLENKLKLEKEYVHTRDREKLKDDLEAWRNYLNYVISHNNDGTNITLYITAIWENITPEALEWTCNYLNSKECSLNRLEVKK